MSTLPPPQFKALERVLGRHADWVAERVACRVAELLRERDEGARMLTAAEVAELLGRSRDFVYGHAAELGGAKLGDGPRPRWAFPRECVRAYLDGEGRP
ncbi:MAG: helix-turn-helix domain-containing protein [Actinomycetota bacterium]